MEEERQRCILAERCQRVEVPLKQRRVLLWKNHGKMGVEWDFMGFQIISNSFPLRVSSKWCFLSKSFPGWYTYIYIYVYIHIYIYIYMGRFSKMAANHPFLVGFSMRKTLQLLGQHHDLGNLQKWIQNGLSQNRRSPLPTGPSTGPIPSGEWRER